MSAVDYTAQQVGLLVNDLDGVFDDSSNVWVAVSPGGYGSTSASVNLAVADDGGKVKRFLVRIDEIEEEEEAV